MSLSTSLSLPLVCKRSAALEAQLGCQCMEARKRNFGKAGAGGASKKQ